jgi:DNA-binding CsgD family transcriptional regulator
MTSTIRQPLAPGAPRAPLHPEQARRFAAAFPRVFAFALAVTAREEASRDVAVAAFCDAFALGSLSEQEFIVELFRAARERARHFRGRSPLAARELDVISLTFDAQLSPAQVSLVLGIERDAVAQALLKGLRKLQLRPSTDAALAGIAPAG